MRRFRIRVGFLEFRLLEGIAAECSEPTAVRTFGRRTCLACYQIVLLLCRLLFSCAHFPICLHLSRGTEVRGWHWLASAGPERRPQFCTRRGEWHTSSRRLNEVVQADRKCLGCGRRLIRSTPATLNLRADEVLRAEDRQSRRCADTAGSGDQPICRNDAGNRIGVGRRGAAVELTPAARVRRRTPRAAACW